MAAFKTAEATTQDTGLLASRVSSKKATGDIRWLEATYTATGTEAASGDTIEIGDVPVGANVIPELFRIANEASMGGSDLAITGIGDSGSATRYSATSLSVHSSNAAVQAITPNVAGSVISRYSVTESTKRLIATFTRTNAMTAGKKIVFLVPFRLP